LSFKLNDIVGNIFHTDKKEKEKADKQSAELQQKTNNVFGANEKPKNNTYNPFLKQNGELLNPLLNYQKILDNPNVADITKKYISQATGLLPTASVQSSSSSSSPTSSRGAYTPSKNSSRTASASPTGNTIADAAQKYLGTPYVWGGESMEEGGMDCSGFVYNALRDAGHNVGRTTAQGYRSQGTVVSKAEMQPGDLIFYGKNTNDASHIGIYIGDGKMIHSSGGSKNTKSNPGKGVSVANVDYRNDFIEARRY
jgi:cell wall-associated NlpC family hydrolase